MAKKLGKKARKFAKKNLQSVLKRKRKLKSFFKKKSAKRDERGEADGSEEERIDSSNGRNSKVEDIRDLSLEAIFGGDVNDVDGDDSDSDGYLSEDTSCIHMSEAEKENSQEYDKDEGTSSVQNREIQSELGKKMKKLERLKDKDPVFTQFLESNKKRLRAFTDEQNYSDEDETSDDGRQSVDENGRMVKSKILSSFAVDSLYQLVMEQQNVSALKSLLNGYRAACHYGNESSNLVEDSKTYCKILMLVLNDADGIFRKMLGIPLSNDKKEAILDLKNNLKWKTLRPLIKSYLRSTLFLLNEVNDSSILTFALTRIRASLVFFATFYPSLQRLIKLSVHLWSMGERTLSLHSFQIIQDVAAIFNSECFDICLIKAYKAFIGRCKFLEPALLKHVQFLKNSFVNLCSQDVQKSVGKARVSIQQLAKILQLGLQTKKKEAVKKISSWQYVNCIDIWVTFISANIHDYDLQQLLYMIIQIINGVAVLFPGQRYLLLRVKCIQWLNHLSSSCGVFIPVASLVLDVLEYKIGKLSQKPGKDFNVSSAIKLPKYWLKSRSFQEQCVFSAIELLGMHFAQWSYHISFPELATIPVIRLKKFHDTTSIESFRRMVKHFIDQVEKNIEFVRKKRDEVAFSPKDQQPVESFLQLEKSSGNASFTQYYRSLAQKAASRNLFMNGKSLAEQKKSTRNRQQPPNKIVAADVNGEAEYEKKNEGDF